jgi:hypothetical protein
MTHPAVGDREENGDSTGDWWQGFLAGKEHRETRERK